MRGPLGGRSAVPSAGRRIFETPLLRLNRVVQQGGRAGTGADDHAARSAHTCASLAVSSGANVLAVSRMLGHKDPSVTLRIYADLFDSDLDAVAVNLDAKISGSVHTVSKELADRRRKRRITAV